MEYTPTEPAVAPVERITTALDVAGLVAVAAGLSWGLWAVIGAYALAVGGTVILAGSRLAAWLAVRPPAEPTADPGDPISGPVAPSRASRRRRAGASPTLARLGRLELVWSAPVHGAAEPSLASFGEPLTGEVVS